MSNDIEMSVTSSAVSTPLDTSFPICDRRPSTILLAYDLTAGGPGGLGTPWLAGMPGMSEPLGGIFLGVAFIPPLTPGSVLGLGDFGLGGELLQLSSLVWSLSLVSTSVNGISSI